MLKPHKEFYQYALTCMNTKAEDCILIDDQIKNLEAANKLGMRVIHVSNYKDPQAYQKIREELIHLGIISE